jgi:hypothetical protein
MTDWADYYRKAWAKRTEIFEDLMQDEDSLPRVLGRFDWWERHNRLVMDNATGVMSYVPNKNQPKAAISYTNLLFDLAHGHDMVIEYGCGYGKRLMELSLAGCDIPMLGLDISPEGVQLGRKLAALDDAVTVGFTVGGWDYKPLFPPGKFMVFTYYSAMYQDPFPEEWFQQDATIVMIEPVETIKRLMPLIKKYNAIGVCGE